MRVTRGKCGLWCICAANKPISRNQEIAERSAHSSCRCRQPRLHSPNVWNDNLWPRSRCLCAAHQTARLNMKVIGRVLVALIAALAALFVSTGTSHAGLDNELSVVDGKGR